MQRTFATSKLSSYNQTVIPKRVRKIMGLVEGSIIRYERDGDAVRICRLDADVPGPLSLKHIHPLLTIPPNVPSTVTR